MSTEASRAASKRFRLKQKIARYGPELANVDMRGKHGNQARGKKNGRWNGGRWIHQDGYIAIAVPPNHHLRMKNGYAYLHQIKAEEYIGRRLRAGETVHHDNGNVKDNSRRNLVVMTRSGHAVLHANRAIRSAKGQFVPTLKR